MRVTITYADVRLLGGSAILKELAAGSAGGPNPPGSSAALESNMATLRQQIATNVLTVTRFRELMKKLRENRPNDD